MDNNINEDELIKGHRNGKRMAGLVIVAVGAVLLSRQMGVIFPEWLLSWPMLLIVMGLYVGAKHQFRKPGWIFMCLAGGIFLMDEFVPGISLSYYMWPVLIIIIGLFMIFGRENKWEREWKRRKAFGKNAIKEAMQRMETNPEDYINHVSIFGSIEKNIISKDFRGGDIVCIFSGTEINLSRAEIKQPVVMEVVNVFGGTSLILPPNWEVKSEMVAILGGIEDKRIQQASIPDNQNILIIRGTTVLGGIEIKSF